jgi:hypothetical protein
VRRERRTEEEIMKKRGAISLSIIFAAALALAMVVPGARADAQNQMSQLTFSQPLRIPGQVVLPAGTYWFKLTDSTADQNVVQIYNSNWSLVATTIAIPALRPEATDHTMLTFAEGSSRYPAVLVKWFYPGRLTGHEFLYSAPMENRISEDHMITVKAEPAPHGTQIASSSY